MEEILLKKCRIILDAFETRRNLDIKIRDGFIEEISENLSTNGITIDCSNSLVIPGIFNGHTHSPMSLLRGIAEDLPLHKWLTERVWPIERKLKEEHFYIGAKLSALEMLKHGFTGCADMYFKMENVAKAFSELNFRGVLCEGLFDFFDKNKIDEKIKIAEQSFKLLSNYSPLIKPSFGPHAIYTCSKELLEAIAELSNEMQGLVQIHVAESVEEQQESIKRYGLREVAFLDEIGLCNERTIYAHAVWLSNEEINRIKKKDAALVQNTISNLKLAVGSTCDISTMLKEGIRFCLGTDGPASNNSLDAFEMLKFSALLQKHMHRDPSIISANEIFKAATYGAYRIFFPELKAGLIKEGFIADLVILDLNELRLRPLSNKYDKHALNHLVYSCSGIKAKHVIVNGRLSIENYTAVKINEEELVRDFEKAFNEIYEVQ